MAFCVPIASIVTTHPASSKWRSSSGMAVTSLLFSSTFSCPRTRPFSWPQALRFAQTSYLRVIKTGFTVNYQDHGWAALRQVIALRNRLTHPKTKEDLTVSNEAVNHVTAANDCFRDTFFHMTHAGNERLEAFVALLK
jgi:hypothetical protein